MPRLPLVALLALTLAPAARAEAPDPATVERGRRALETTAFIKGFWPTAAVENAWKVWGLPAKPADFAEQFRERYGLHPAPYPNHDLPMGLRPASLLFGTGVGIDCMTCHGGRLFGKSIVGLGNSSLELQGLFEELARAGGSPLKMKYHASQVRGTNEAGSFSVYLLGLRNDDLSLRSGFRDLGLRDDSCEDVPAWWLLKRKKTMYHTGGADARSVRSIMQFLLHPLTTATEFDKAEPAFRDVQQYLLSIEPPNYPFPVDAQQVKAGAVVFRENCARCHGEGNNYPNKIVPLADIGTDPKRWENISPAFGEAYNASWFAQESPGGAIAARTAGYQAPPLDGIWATAPYLHNGSVPTLMHLLDSKSRPKVFTRSYRTDEADYDTGRVGWKTTECPPAGPELPPIERRKVYDTTQPGRGNAGHTYGDDLTDAERRAVVEYLKTR